MPTKNIIALLAVLLVIAACRLYFVETFAISLPYWDQWDAEGDFLLRSWIEGRLQIHELWQPHNEHRIFPTRLLSLLIFNVTGTWNNLVEARVNIGLALCIPLIIILFLMQRNALRGLRWLILLVIVAQFALPFPFENLLVGFQSQFYFLIIFTLLALILATRCPDNLVAMSGMLLLSILSVLTMGSGLLTPLAVAGMYVLQWYVQARIGWVRLAFVALLTILAATGYLILPHIEANQVYRAKNLADLTHALRYILSWPGEGSWLVAVALWVPSIMTIPWLLAQRKLQDVDLMMAGCALWSLMQALAIAYGRGQELTEVSSRYTELFSIGLVANAWFAIRLVEDWGIRRVVWCPVLFFTVLIAAHGLRFSDDMDDMRASYQRSLIQLHNVQAYYRTGDPATLVQPLFHIPYPDNKRLRELLDQPTIRRILPREVTGESNGK